MKIKFYVLFLISFTVFGQFNDPTMNAEHKSDVEYTFDISYKNRMQISEYIETSHPISLSERQIKRILYCIKMNVGRPEKLFNVSQIIDLGPEVKKAFEKASENDVLVIKKNKFVKKELDSSFTIFLYFNKDQDISVFTMTPKGSVPPLLETGYGIRRTGDYTGKIRRDFITLYKKLWNEDITKEVFKREMKDELLNYDPDANPSKLDEKKMINSDDSEAQLSIDEIKKELDKLKQMLDNNLITEEEYNKLKEKVLKKAGL